MFTEQDKSRIIRLLERQVGDLNTSAYKHNEPSPELSEELRLVADEYIELINKIKEL